jgi:hypothetical protein
MPEGSEERLSLRQADQVRGDLYAIHDEIEFIRDHFARQPTRMDWGARARRLGADHPARRAFSGFVPPLSLVRHRPARDCFAALAMTAPV